MRLGVENSCKNFAKNFQKFLPALAVAVLPGISVAQEVVPCDARASVGNVMRPWQDNTRAFANGAVELVRLDAGAPEAGALYLAVISPPLDADGRAQCRLIGWRDGRGFAQLDFAALQAGYDPAKGLTFALPGLFVLPEEGFSNSFLLSFTLNQASGEIFADMMLGPE